MENIKMKEIEGYIARHGKYLVIGYGKCRIAFMHDKPVPNYPKEQQTLQFLSKYLSFSGKRHLLLITEQDQITS